MPRLLSPTLCLSLLPAAALAHARTGTGAGLAAGIAHPLGGADHALAMIAVGLWAAQAGGAALWAAPLVFVASMAAGAALGLAGIALPGVEPVILASVMILGAAVAAAARPPLAAALAALAAFGLAHGWAHGAEAPDAGVAAYAAGFVLATLTLHALGLVLGLLAARGLRIAGGATLAAGLALAFSG